MEVWGQADFSCGRSTLEMHGQRPIQQLCGVTLCVRLRELTAVVCVELERSRGRAGRVPRGATCAERPVRARPCAVPYMHVDLVVVDTSHVPWPPRVRCCVL